MIRTSLLRSYLAFCFFVSTCVVGAQDLSDSQAEGASIETHQWEMCEIRLASKSNAEASAEGVELYAVIRDEAGSQFRVPGFFDGGNQFVVRFTPPSAGKWTYELESSLPEFDGRRGAVIVQPPKAGRRGGIVVPTESPRRFEYQNGDSYFPIAFECDWLFALDAENADDIPMTRQLVDRLAENGFNQIVMNVFAYDVNWKKDENISTAHEFGAPSVFPFGGDNTSPDHSRINVEYFHRLDRVVDYLDEKGIAAHIMIYVWNKQVNWPPADSEADNRYFDYVVKRYQAYPNVIWDISKEALGYGHTDVDYITQRIARLRNIDAHDRLVTVHDYGYCKKFPDQLDFISVQLWGSELHGTMRNVVNDFPDKPILNIEHGGYEEGPYEVFTGNYTSAEVCLERAYQCVFAGTYPTHYWQGAAWNVIVADIESLPPDDRPRLEYYKHLSTLVETYGLDRLQSGGKHSNSGFCLTDGQSRYIYYVPKENMSMNLRFQKDRRGQIMTYSWFDPFSGEFSESTTQRIEQWPVVRKPKGDKFSILIVDLPNN